MSDPGEIASGLSAAPVVPPQIEVRYHAISSEEARDEIVETLRRDPPSLPTRYFYDERGSALFEEITRLPEYYPTRAEREILSRHSDDVARRTLATQMVEIGSGAAEKTRWLLDALRDVGTLRSYVPLDVSGEFLRAAAETLARDYPGLEIHGIVADFNTTLTPLPEADGPRLAIFLGGTIGNLHPRTEAPAFLDRLAAALSPGDWFLLGVDRIKDRATLERAYNDAAGVTAEFNRNILRVVSRKYGLPLDPTDFEHLAFWDEQESWIEMRLVARRDLEIPLGDGAGPLQLRPGDAIRTEISAKYDDERVCELLAPSSFTVETCYSDAKRRFSLYLARRE